EWAQGGDAWMESTPPVLTWYQARAGQIFTLAMGVERLRQYSLQLQGRLVTLLAERGLNASGATSDRGAFVVVTLDSPAMARRYAEALQARGVITDARGVWLRLCPDLLTTAAELERGAEATAEVTRSFNACG